EEALGYAKQAAESHTVGDPRAEGIQLGPVVSETQYNKIQKLIQSGVTEGAALVTGGLGRPQGLQHGYFARPTVFGPVKPNSRPWTLPMTPSTDWRLTCNRATPTMPARSPGSCGPGKSTSTTRTGTP